MDYLTILGIILVIFLAFSLTYAVHIAEIRNSSKCLICCQCSKTLQGQDIIYVIGIYVGTTIYCASCHLTDLVLMPISAEDNNYYDKYTVNEYIEEYGDEL